MAPTENDEIVDTKEMDGGVMTDSEGNICINLLQQDLIGIRHRYADGTVDLWVRPAAGGDARIVVPRYNPDTEQAKCRHCGEVL